MANEKRARIDFTASQRERLLIEELAKIQDKNISETIRDAVKEAAIRRGLSIDNGAKEQNDREHTN